MQVRCKQTVYPGSECILVALLLLKMCSKEGWRQINVIQIVQWLSTTKLHNINTILTWCDRLLIFASFRVHGTPNCSIWLGISTKLWRPRHTRAHCVSGEESTKPVSMQPLLLTLNTNVLESIYKIVSINATRLTSLEIFPLKKPVFVFVELQAISWSEQT